MTASRHARAARKTEDEALRKPESGLDDALADDAQAGAAALPNLDRGQLDPEAWLSLQQALGNSAVGGLLERQAHAAGRSAAAGQKAEVSATPEAAGAVARFGLSDLKKMYEAATGGETANRVERTELSDEEKDRLASGALDPLGTMLAALVSKVGQQGGKVNPKTLQPIADNTAGLSKFIMSFNGPPAVQPQLESA